MPKAVQKEVVKEVESLGADDMPSLDDIDEAFSDLDSLKQD